MFRLSKSRSNKSVDLSTSPSAGSREERESVDHANNCATSVSSYTNNKIPTKHPRYSFRPVDSNTVDKTTTQYTSFAFDPYTTLSFNPTTSYTNVKSSTQYTSLGQKLSRLQVRTQ
ncbi:hypothetical protein PTNB85_06547 [Pyrenophora teres f. teres]|nr:hypothetical protein HRS9139_07810 [Pyrenophora teres f. teres]KAE8832155.1 hypothetical protein PTNB85_06547 [Pyrenophora teres f. teres]KAE8855816.1 hypothetical protein PTNB29_08655 [Pyrenophora teres f. teres]